MTTEPPTEDQQIADLNNQITRLKEIVRSGILFQITEDVSIGTSEQDDRWRICREISERLMMFMAHDGTWRWPHPPGDGSSFSVDTGFEDALAAFDAIDVFGLAGTVEPRAVDPASRLVVLAGS